MASKVIIDSTNPAGAFPGLLWDRNTSGALIVVHEVWGLTRAIQKQATAICNKVNVTVLAVDLFRGWNTDELKDAVEHFEALDWDAALKDVAAAVKFLKSKGCQKVSEPSEPREGGGGGTKIWTRGSDPFEGPKFKSEHFGRNCSGGQRKGSLLFTCVCVCVRVS